jgi:hypothetical protein
MEVGEDSTGVLQPAAAAAQAAAVPMNPTPHGKSFAHAEFVVNLQRFDVWSLQKDTYAQYKMHAAAAG